MPCTLIIILRGDEGDVDDNEDDGDGDDYDDENDKAVKPKQIQYGQFERVT